MSTETPITKRDKGRIIAIAVYLIAIGMCLGVIIASGTAPASSGIHQLAGAAAISGPFWAFMLWRTVRKI